MSDDKRTQGGDQSGKGYAQAKRTTAAEAKKKRSWWPGWIWAIPVAALGIAAWLLIRFLTQGGTDITITFPNVYGIDPSDTNIMYLGMKVGKTNGMSLAKNGTSVEVKATIDDSASKFLKTGTLFWLKGAHVSLSNLSSLGSILSGPKMVMQPGPGKDTKDFQGVTNKPLPADRGSPVFFVVSFEEAVGELSEGDPVQLRGFPIGEIKNIGFHFDANTGAISTPVTLALYPRLFHIEHANLPNAADEMRAVVNELIEKGLRARLAREPALIGSYQLSLQMIPGAPATEMKIVDSMPEIPTAPGGGLDSILDRVKGIPLEQIGQNLLDITKQADQIVSSPKLDDAVGELDASLKEIHKVVGNIGPKVDKLVQDLRNTAGQLDQAAQGADRILGGAPTQTGLNDTLREVKEAARSIRALADYLDRHPEALITGKSRD